MASLRTTRTACIGRNAAFPVSLSRAAASRRSRSAQRVHVQTGWGDVGPTLTAEAPEEVALPDGLPSGRSVWRHYETLLCLSAIITEDQRDRELARLESFLLNNNAQNVKVDVRGPYKLAYPIKRNAQGWYALFTYTAKRHVSKDVEYLLSHPDVGTEDFILLYKTFVR